MEYDEKFGLKEKIAKGVSKKIEETVGIWPCLMAFFGEPKMPMELFMEDSED